MLGVSGLLGSSGDGAASAVVATSSGPPEGGGGLELGGGGGSNSGGFSEDDKAAAAATRGEEGDRSSAGSRWPRQETLALLKIRSDMDVAFKDSSLKGPLWEEVSRKLAELGYQRSAKKCKEKFENVYKYHKRTKEGRASKPDAKTYRFFEQLEALDTHPIHNIPPPLGPPALPPPLPLHQQLHHHHHQPKSQPPAASAQPPPLMLPAATTPQPLQQITVPSATANKPAANNSSTAASQNTSASAPTTLSTINPSPLPPQAALQHPRNPTNIPQATSMMNPSSQSQPHSFRNLHASNSTSSSSSTSSDETLDGNDGGGRKRKRKWKDFFERLMRDVIKKQEELQKRFLEAIEKRERDRLVREEAWRMQEMTRMNREHEILVKERSIAAAKDAALIAFLQKVSSDPHNPVPVPPVPEDAAAVALQVVSPPLPQPSIQAQPQPQAQSQPQTPVAAAQQPQQQQQQATPTSPTNFGSIVRVNNNSIVAVGFGGGLEGTNVTSPASTSSSRWPKTEVQALIKLRTDLDMKYQESGPKGPLWEEISAGMRQLGYTRNAKRCKEKWENINKYFKKVKESNKKRPEDSKTCPYFHQLDALYREKTLMLRADVGGSSSSNPPNPNYVPMLKPPAVALAQPTPTPTPTALPMMVRPEQQWPPLHPEDQRAPPEDIGSENMEEPNPDDDMDDDGDVGDDDDEEEEEDDEGGGYEIVTNKQKPAAGDS